MKSFDRSILAMAHASSLRAPSERLPTREQRLTIGPGLLAHEQWVAIERCVFSPMELLAD